MAKKLNLEFSEEEKFTIVKALHFYADQRFREMLDDFPASFTYNEFYDKTVRDFIIGWINTFIIEIKEDPYQFTVFETLFENYDIAGYDDKVSKEKFEEFLKKYKEGWNIYPPEQLGFDIEEKIIVEVDIAFGKDDHTNYDIAQDLLEIMWEWSQKNIQYKVMTPNSGNGWPVFQLTGSKSKIKEWYLKDYNPGESFEEFLEHSQIK